jgi:hypothetical protein
MIYIIGGASRSGKTLLARRVVAEKRIPYFPLDALFGALANGAPQLGVAYENSLMERPVKMWPITKPLLEFFFAEEKDFLIEGDSILPSQIQELLVANKPVKACFIGYTKLDANEKLETVRRYHQGEIDWTKGISDTEMLPMVDEMIEFSKYLEQECDRLGIKYFDVSQDFEGVRDEVFEYLFDDAR